MLKKQQLRPKLSYLGVFGQELEKTLVMSEISTLGIAKMQSLNQKNLNLGPKLTCYGTFRPEFEKLLLYLKSAPPPYWSKCKVSF